MLRVIWTWVLTVFWFPLRVDAYLFAKRISPLVATYMEDGDEGMLRAFEVLTVAHYGRGTDETKGFLNGVGLALEAAGKKPLGGWVLPRAEVHDEAP